MNYYGNNNSEWKQQSAIDEQKPSGDNSARFDGQYGQDRGSFGTYEQQGQPNMPLQRGMHNSRTPNHNEYLDKQGIPTISPEDMQILRECSRESLYFRCVPLSAALCAGIVFAARVRQFKPRWSHYFGAVLLGYFTGKISYRSTCESKLINSRSNSPFVNAIRKRRGLYVEEFAQDNPCAESSAFESDWTTSSAKSYGIDEFDRDYDKSLPYAQSSNFNRRAPLGQDEFVSPDGSQDGSTLRPGTTYDELRLRNRSSLKNV